jgi:glycosyltransferase involved in cell wall biosynthesis
VTGPVVLYLGRLSEEKGVEDLLLAVAKLRDRGRQITAVIVGSGPQEAMLRRQIAGRGLEHLVRMVSAVPHGDVVSYYRAADVVVVPSRTTSRIVEQFGRAVIEALACEKPVIGSSAGEVPRLLARTRGGVVFREGDVEDLTRCLETLLDDPARARELAVQGRAAVLRTYSTQAEASQLKCMYDSVLAGASAR